MQNEFEKRVQQKLEELDLVPSAPVWPRIEEQIRPKKDRRRLLFWLPLLLLLAGGGWWLLHGDPDVPSSAARKPVATKQPVETGSTASRPAGQPGARLPGTNVPAGSAQDPASVNASARTGAPLRHGPAAPAQPSAVMNRAARAKASVRSGTVSGQELEPSSGEPSERTEAPVQRSTGKTDPITPVNSLPAELNKGRETSVPAGETGIPDASAKLPAPAKDSNLSSAPSAIGDSAAQVKPPVQKKTALGRALRKWELGLTASVGQSRYARGLGLFSMAKSADVTPANQPNVGSGLANRYYQAAPAAPGIALSAGGVMKKGIGKRTKFVTGLQWDFYSTAQTVGKLADSSTGLYNYLNQYNQNSARVDEYRNAFHFLTLPLMIEWKPLARIPVSVNAGLAVQQMVFTNALNYNYGGQYYYYDPKSFTRTQLFGRLGLDAQLRLSGRQVQLGPQLQYGFSRLYRSGENSHLLSYSLRIQWMLKK